MLGAETLPALLFFIVIFFIPESPRWLIVRSREADATLIFGKIYRDKNVVSSQINDTRAMLYTEGQSDTKLLFTPGIFRAVLIGCAIAILGQFMGVNAVLYYGPSIFETSGLSSGDSLFYQSLIGLVNMGTTVLALLIIDKVGRKKLVYTGEWHDCQSHPHRPLFSQGRSMGHEQSLPVGLLPSLHILHGRFYQCRNLCLPLRDVPNKDTRIGHVNCRTIALDWNLLDWTAHSLVAGKCHTCRYILSIRLHVYPLYADCLEDDAGDCR